MGDIIVIGDRRAAEDAEQPQKEPLRLPLTFDGRKGWLVIPQGMPWLPVQHYTPEGVKTYAQLGPGTLEWEDQTNGS